MAPSFAQKTLPVDIQKEVQDKNVLISHREVTFINEPSRKGIHMDERYEDGVVWLKSLEFSNGVVELDVRGRDIRQHSFVGIAFHGTDSTSYDVIYLRPFNFQAKEEPGKSRAIQYVSLPTHTWRILREKFPGRYEHSIDPAPDPNAWVHLKVVVRGSVISAYINGENKPSLTVEKLGTVKSGSVGLYVADTSGGDFANLTVTRMD